MKLINFVLLLACVAGKASAIDRPDIVFIFSDDCSCEAIAQPAPTLREVELLLLPRARFCTYDNVESTKSWTRLFDGKSLKGWQKAPNDSMRVVDGAIQITPDPQVFYLHENEYTDFVLELEAKMPTKEFDSGVGFHCSLPEGAALPKGFQSEISDIRSGGIFDIGVGWITPADDEKQIAAFVKRTGTFFKPGQWNHIRVRCEGSRIQTWINGQLCSDLKDATHQQGMIGLQHHSESGTYSFRNIRIRELSSR